ncbi:MAG: hypothetical protein A2Z38_12590 [Planctomycetes bacterium RBG_19FT_COMBO_48_8]|nr:MAG: hypothetical protein A2Z38_12590 [Planctomycetes bacterium RBG_19FT_COMBO_48_8]
MIAAGKGHSAQAVDALEQLCRTYWYPLYAFIRRQGHGAPDAEDLTQEFFTRFLAKEYFGRADPTLGRFRSYLLACLKNFLTEQQRQAIGALCYDAGVSMNLAPIGDPPAESYKGRYNSTGLMITSAPNLY